MKQNMKNNIKAIEQVMTEKEKIALRLYNQYTTPETGVKIEDIVLDGYYEKICGLIAANATNNDVIDAVYALTCDAEMVGFIQGYTYAIERLKETLLIT